MCRERLSQALAGVCSLCVLCGAAMSRPEGTWPGQEEQHCSGPVREEKGLLAMVLGPGLLRHPLLPSFLWVALADSLATLALFLPFLFLPNLAINEGLGPDKVHTTSLSSTDQTTSRRQSSSLQQA